MRFKIKFILKLLILFLTPLIYEYIGINYGGPMGIRYSYNPNFKPQILGLPALVWIFWVIFILISYHLTNSMIITIFKKDYNIFIKDKFNFLIACFFDGFTTTTFDFFIDPVAVKFNLWRWENFDFTYFGVPVGNFIGWFIIASTTTFLLRMLDYFVSTKTDLNFLKFVPIFYLIILFISFFASTIFFDIELSLMSLLISLPIILISIYLIKINLKIKYL